MTVLTQHANNPTPSDQQIQPILNQLLIETIVGTPRARTAPDTDTMPFGGFGGRTSTTTDDLVARARSNSSSSDSESSTGRPRARETALGYSH